MRNVASVALGFVLTASIVVACVGSSSSGEPTTPGDAPDGGSEAGPGGGCDTGQKSCDGRCVSTDDPSFGCAMPSCAACPGTTTPNTVPSCNAGVCAAGCAPGFGDCDGNPNNGCETKIETDIANCGKCGNKCGNAHTTGSTCEASKCVFQCETGWAHCGADPAGCDKNVEVDDKNCGACGRDCVGGTCAANQCSIVTLAASQPKPAAIALDALNVYYVNTDTNQIMRVRKDGTCIPAAPCPAEIVAPAAGVESPQAIATDGTNLFWSNYNGGAARQTRRASVSGAGPADVGASYGTFAGFLAMAGGKAAWTSRYGTDHVYRADANGANVAIVANGNIEPGWVGIDATHVYWASYGNAKLYRHGVGAAPCTMGVDCQELTTAVNIYAIAIDATHVYFTELQAAGAVRKIAKTGGAVTTLATGQGQPQTIATDGVHVYWGNFGDGTVRRASVNAATSCTDCELVANASLPNAIAVDDKAVYWVQQFNGGGVYKRAK